MRAQGTGKWYQLEDLRVTEVLPQLIQLSEAYIQVTPMPSSCICSALLCTLSTLASTQIYEVNRERRNPHYNPLMPVVPVADARTEHFST